MAMLTLALGELHPGQQVSAPEPSHFPALKDPWGPSTCVTCFLLLSGAKLFSPGGREGVCANMTPAGVCRTSSAMEGAPLPWNKAPLLSVLSFLLMVTKKAQGSLAQTVLSSLMST